MLKDNMISVVFKDKSDVENNCFVGDEFILYRNDKNENPLYYFPHEKKYVAVFPNGCLFVSINKLTEVNKKFKLKEEE